MVSVLGGHLRAGAPLVALIMRASFSTQLMKPLLTAAIDACKTFLGNDREIAVAQSLLTRNDAANRRAFMEFTRSQERPTFNEECQGEWVTWAIFRRDEDYDYRLSRDDHVSATSLPLRDPWI